MRGVQKYKKYSILKEINEKPSEGIKTMPAPTEARPADFDATKKQEINSQTLIELGKQAFKNKETGQPEGFMMILEKLNEYAPLIKSFVQGFAANMKDSQAQKQQQQPQLQAPEGWSNMSPMERLKYKYTRPEWYAAGLRYTEGVQAGINPAVNTQYVDPTYSEKQPKNLAELQRKYPEPPMANDSPPSQSHEKPPTSAVKKDITPQETISSSQQKQGVFNKEEEQMIPSEKEQLSQVQQALQADNARYIQMAMQFVNKRGMKDFQKDVKDPESLAKLLGKFTFLLPVHVKSMINNTPASELEAVFKQACPEKYAWLVKQKKVPALLNMFEKLKESLTK
jgi:hypothetical protein